MLDGDSVAGAMAYEALHVPALFAEWVSPVLDATGVGEGGAFLDVACGTGILARGAVERVGTEGRVMGVDPDPGMLTVARRIEPSVTWRRGVAEALPFHDETFDAVGSQFGMMFFDDRYQATREMLRVVRAGGRITVAVWDVLERHPAYAAEVDLLDAMAGPAAAAALRAPFVLGDPSEVVELFEAAGARDVEVTSRTGRARFPAVSSLVGADLRGWLPVMGIQLAEDLVERILEEAEGALGGFAGDDGTVEFESPAHIVSAARA